MEAVKPVKSRSGSESSKSSEKQQITVEAVKSRRSSESSEK